MASSVSCCFSSLNCPLNSATRIASESAAGQAMDLLGVERVVEWMAGVGVWVLCEVCGGCGGLCGGLLALVGDCGAEVGEWRVAGRVSQNGGDSLVVVDGGGDVEAGQEW